MRVHLHKGVVYPDAYSFFVFLDSLQLSRVAVGWVVLQDERVLICPTFLTVS